MKISPVGAEFLVGIWMNGQTDTDMTKLMLTLCNHANMPKTLKPCLGGDSQLFADFYFSCVNCEDRGHTSVFK
jgi:hypothetical protein